MGDRKEELVTTPFSEKKSLIKDVEKGTDKLADMLFMANKYLKKDVDKCTDKLADMKQAVNIICRKILDQFEGQSSESKGWFKLDIGFLKTNFPENYSKFYKELLEKK